MSSIPLGGTLFFVETFYGHLHANFVQKCQICQICVIYKNFDCLFTLTISQLYKLNKTKKFQRVNTSFWKLMMLQRLIAVVDPKGVPPAHAPLRPKIFLISCSFWEILTKSYVGAPPRMVAPSYRESWIRPWIGQFKSHMIKWIIFII